MRIAIDSSVLVGLVVPADAWHLASEALMRAIRAGGHRPVYLDCVATESATTVLRRLREKRRAGVGETLDRLIQQVPVEEITWVMPDVPALYTQALDLMRATDGELNFNDALIALSCRERGIEAIASFDADFDRVLWLRRWSRPEDLAG
ncbi:MAG: type II toxin-antitoxin system VapC family toxin [Anaerolineae bacterium]